MIWAADLSCPYSWDVDLPCCRFGLITALSGAARILVIAFAALL